MILAMGLLSVSAILVLIGPRVLTRAAVGAIRRPLANLIACVAISWVVVINIALAAALLAWPSLATVGRLPAGLESCLAAFHDLARPIYDPRLRVSAAVLLSALLGRLLVRAARSALSNRHKRARHRALLTLLSDRQLVHGAHVVPDPTPAVYCLPGRGGRVVFTTAALSKLTTEQCAAVLAHERAHLRGRHHLLIASANLLAGAFPYVSLFRCSAHQTSRLVEMRADDLASRGHGRRSIASALLALAEIGSSPTVLAATAVTTIARVERLLTTVPAGTSWNARGKAAGRAASALVLLASAPLILSITGHAVLCAL